MAFTHSPYVLSPVLQKKWFLHPSRPRPTSPALLATMLWCVARTADSPIFHLPGSRRDMDNWRRVRGWQLEEDSATSLDTDRLGKSRRTFSTGPTPCVDDVLTFLLLTIVISGGEYKSDCIKWWNKTVGLIKHLRLHKEPSMSRQSQGFAEEHEERRRVFWLAYTMDSHLALSHNRPLDILDAECEVFNPLPDNLWQTFDTLGMEALQLRTYGPPMTISGTGFFEYSLPMMAILGGIIDFRLRRYHPLLVSNDDAFLELIKANLTCCERSICELSDTQSLSRSPSGTWLQRSTAKMVVAYAVHIIKVLYVLVYGNWDAITMFEDDGDWITSSSRPELSFMSYLFGIYLLHGSFVLLLFAERMSRVGPNPSVEEACEVIIRAHEVAIVTLNTEFQPIFRKEFRSRLYNARRSELSEAELETLRKEVLSTYRSTMGRRGLCL
ncbi:fungal-specific transcription factor domain-containing protein [Aspergillus novoparasiticus]|uniref:Fungal-specific transcription factor domain-containing protein n=1 Tax=Aspergillus novoparasiticus TaxID=986946 RepID=A0A5N6EUD2_9EURO|nr:fungal-specific transcription factor domain-containing protein [Aspergillus novoparasiticus]